MIRRGASPACQAGKVSASASISSRAGPAACCKCPQKRRWTAGPFFHCDHPLSPGQQQSPGQPARPRAYLNPPCRTGCARLAIRPVRVRSKQKILTEGFFCLQIRICYKGPDRGQLCNPFCNLFRRSGHAGLLVMLVVVGLVMLGRLAAISRAMVRAAIRLSGRALP